MIGTNLRRRLEKVLLEKTALIGKAVSTSHVHHHHSTSYKTRQDSTKLYKTRQKATFCNFSWHDSKFSHARTFSIEFSEASRLQNLKLHVKMWDWTRGNPKRLTGSGAQAQKPITCMRAVNRQPWFPREELVETAMTFSLIQTENIIAHSKFQNIIQKKAIFIFY